MKKFLVLAALALMTVGIATQADARIRPVRENLPWKTFNVNVPGGGWIPSTTTQPLASGALDTTVVFNLNRATPLGPGGFSDDAEAQDSTLIGFIVAYQDSTADGASTLTAATATIEASKDGNDWALVGTIACIAASDDPVVAFPLYLKNVSQQANLLAAPMLRVRFASVTGILTACRLQLRYWVDDDVETVVTEVPWASYTLGSSAEPVITNSNSSQPIASAALDTTGVFNLYNASLRGPGGFSDNFGSQDSILVGYMVIYSDSTADVSNTLTAATVTIDGSFDGRDWVAVATGSIAATSDDPVACIPLIANPGLDHQQLLTLVPALRARFTTVTGIMTAGHVRLVWWKDKE